MHILVVGLVSVAVVVTNLPVYAASEGIAAPRHRAARLAQQAGDVFAIYLATEALDGRVVAYGRGSWTGVRLSPTPLISPDDIISYDWSTHAMKLRSAAFPKLRKALEASHSGDVIHGIPFVVVAQGKRVYVGVFLSPLSSFWPAVPKIVLTTPLLHPQLHPQQLDDDTLLITGGYLYSSSGVRADPRGDARVKSALMALGKLPVNR